MSITINGTTGIAGVDGTAAAPSVQGADSNTGVFFPAADTVAIATGGTERMRVDSSGNLQFSGTGQRILGDFTNATEASRLLFQTSTVNQSTIVGIIPNGTSTTASLGLMNNSDPTNTGRLSAVINSTETSIRSAINGSGTLLPMTFHAGGSERMRIDTAGQIGIGGANYGTSGQVLTSGGSGAAPSWASLGFSSAVLTSKAGSRANGTTYQNTTNGWLFVSVRDSNNGQAFSVGPSSASLTIFNTNIAPGTAIGLVPPGYYYSISGSVLQSWYEGQA